MGQSLITAVKIMTMGEPKKSFLKAGVTDMDGTLTREGTEVFLQFLLEQNGAAFLKEVVKPILDAQKKDK